MNLADRFIELLHMSWLDFIKLEHDDNALSDEAMLCGLIRACAEGDMRSIKTAFARSDGEVEIPVQINVPKFFTRYLVAKDAEKSKKTIEAGEVATTTDSDYDLATAKLRQTLNEMRRAPKKVVEVVLGMRSTVDDRYKKGMPMPKDNSIPLVKSVISANLLRLAGRGNSGAITEVFNQIDGKLVRTITLLGGEDVYVDDYITEVAPSGAVKDSDGYYVAENKAMKSVWLRGLAKMTPQLVLEDEDEDYNQ